MLTRLIVVINSQYKYVSNYVVYLKVIHCYVNYILILGLFFLLERDRKLFSPFLLQSGGFLVLQYFTATYI